jgi:hypothetical protein
MSVLTSAISLSRYILQFLHMAELRKYTEWLLNIVCWLLQNPRFLSLKLIKHMYWKSWFYLKTYLRWYWSKKKLVGAHCTYTFHLNIYYKHAKIHYYCCFTYYDLLKNIARTWSPFKHTHKRITNGSRYILNYGYWSTSG